ncbi:uncharacterized protein LOC111319306, partial [Stylophora pistillata]|uniref:uncharacterized protein LOC111319306 n=1 Tax=Stylophora pistillata TaxID=50429 RepID=UPI000C03E03A
NAISDVFATSSPKDQLVFLCVRIQPNQSPYIETIVNADFGSKRSSDGVRNEKVQWTQVIIGQNQDIDGTITTDFPFYGRISNLNIWFNSLTDDHITNWYNSGKKHYKPNILKWPDLGSSSKRFGDVHFVKVTSAERRWYNVSVGDVDVKSTTYVVATKTVESGSGVVIEVERQSLLPCTGINAIDSSTVDGVFISVSGSWKRIKYKQTFLETQKCFAIFGSVPDWASGLYTSAVSEFDLDLDELWKEEYLSPEDCNANPCKNGGTCVEAPSAQTYTCNCTDSFTGKNCSESIAEEQSTDYNAAPTVASLNRGNGEPLNQNDYDFELVFRKTQQTNYVKHDMNKKWIERFTVCAWIHTPDIQQDQNMTVISILTEKNGGNRNVMTVRIDGKGKIYFSIGSDW